MKRLEIEVSETTYDKIKEYVRLTKLEKVELVLKCIITNNADDVELMYAELKK